jgi:acetyl-CoA carboxylase beta subunit
MRKTNSPGTKLKKGMKRLDRIAMMLVISAKDWRKVRDNLWHHCPSCGEAYCHSFTGEDQYCYDCPYHGCIKEQGDTAVCQECGNVRKFH